MEEDKEYIKLPVEDRCVHKVNKNSNIVVWMYRIIIYEFSHDNAMKVNLSPSNIDLGSVLNGLPEPSK